MNAPNTPATPNAQRPPANAQPAFKMQITRGALKEPERIIIHGAPGIGKSSLAAQMPRPLFLDLEHGTQQLDVARVDNIATWAQLNATLHSLASEDTGFETLVIDTLDRAEWLCHQHVCELARVPSIEKVGKFGAGWTAAYEHFRGFAKRLEEIRARRRMKIILISHSKVEKVPNAAGDDFDRWTLKVNKQIAGMFYEGFDAVLFARLNTYTRTTENGRTRGVGDDRVIETQESPAWLAKNRYGLPKQINLDWTELAAGLDRGATEQAAALRVEVDAALVRLSGLDADEGARATAAGASASDVRSLSALLNKIHARIAAREAALSSDNASPDNANTNA